MINIDYKLTLQDELDSRETNMEYGLSNPWIKWLLVRGLIGLFIFLGLFATIDGILHNSNKYANWNILTGIILIILAGIFRLIFSPKLAQSKLVRSNLEKTWNKKSRQEEFRNITVTETELIFKTEFTESAWKLTALKKYFEGSKGFDIYFFSEDVIYIPKRIFKNEETLDDFRKKLNHSSN